MSPSAGADVVRLLETRRDADGTARFEPDQTVAATVYSDSGNGFHHLWGADGPIVATPGNRGLDLAPVPLPGAARFGVFRLQPDPESKGPGMHATDTVDLAIVLQGEVVLELDSGERRVMQAGDTLIQNATVHRWHNHGTQVALLAVVVLGASVDS